MNTDIEKVTMTVPEAGRALGISRSLAFEMARQGKLPVLRLGRRLLVPKAAVHRMLEGAELQQSSEDVGGLS